MLIWRNYFIELDVNCTSQTAEADKTHTATAELCVKPKTHKHTHDTHSHSSARTTESLCSNQHSESSKQLTTKHGRADAHVHGTNTVREAETPEHAPSIFEISGLRSSVPLLRKMNAVECRNQGTHLPRFPCRNSRVLGMV